MLKYHCLLKNATVRRDAKPGGLFAYGQQRGKCFTRRVKKGGGFSMSGWDAGPSQGLAAVAQLSGTTGSEENASRSLHTQRQLGCFSCALSASHLWGAQQSRQRVSPDIKMRCVSSQRGWI